MNSVHHSNSFLRAFISYRGCPADEKFKNWEKRRKESCSKNNNTKKKQKRGQNINIDRYKEASILKRSETRRPTQQESKRRPTKLWPVYFKCFAFVLSLVSFFPLDDLYNGTKIHIANRERDWENYRQPSLDDLALVQNINTRLDQTKQHAQEEKEEKKNVK